jgi:hypothetical protein
MKFKQLREKYRSKYPASLVAAAVKIAIDMGGNMTGAYKKIEAMKRGLADDPIVADALKQANESVNEDYNQDLTLATKNVARLAKKETGQDQKDYQAVSRALAQGNLGAVKKVIKGISTKEIQSDLLNILVGYNDLIAKMYPKAMSGGKFKSGMTVDKIIKEEVISEAKMKDLFRKHKRELTKAYKTGDLSFMSSAGKKAEDDLTQWALNNNEIKSDDPDEFFDWLSRDLEDIVKGRIKEQSLSSSEKKLVNQMYDKKGNLTPLGKKVFNHNKKPGDKGYVENVEEGKVKELQGYIDSGKSAQWISKKMKIDIKHIKSFMDEAVGPEEKAQLALKQAKEVETLKKKHEREKENMKEDTHYLTRAKGKEIVSNFLENYRVLAKHGMGAETKNSIKVGTEVDYYRADGAKYMGKVTKMTPTTYIVKDTKNGKNYQFTYHDRIKAKGLLKK